LIIRDSSSTESLVYTPELLHDIVFGNRTDLVNENTIRELEEVENVGFGDISATRQMLLDNLQNTKGLQILFRENNKVF